MYIIWKENVLIQKISTIDIDFKGITRIQVVAKKGFDMIDRMQPVNDIF